MSTVIPLDPLKRCKLIGSIVEDQAWVYDYNLDRIIDALNEQFLQEAEDAVPVRILRATRFQPEEYIPAPLESVFDPEEYTLIADDIAFIKQLLKEYNDTINL